MGYSQKPNRLWNSWKPGLDKARIIYFSSGAKQRNPAKKKVGKNFHQHRPLQILEGVGPLIEMLGLLPESFHFVQC